MDFWARRSIRTNILGGIIFAAALAALLILAASLLPAGSRSVVAPPALRCLCVLAATLLVSRLYDRMPAAWAGLGLHRWAAREMGLGVALGCGMALIAWALPALAGGVTVGAGWRADDLWYWVLPMVFNAATEELLFRGYLFQRGAEVLGPQIAAVLSAVLFAAGHLGNPNATLLSTLVIFAGGLFFALCYLRTGSLWLPIGAHAAWNLLLAKVLGVPVSGFDFGGTLLNTGAAGPAVLTGGAFGPEGGLAGLLGVAAGIVALARWPAIAYAPYVYAQVFRARLAQRGKGVAQNHSARPASTRS